MDDHRKYPNWILATLVMGTFVAFALPASAQSTNSVLPVMPPGHRSPAAEFGPLGMMKQSLNLSDEQMQKLEPIMKEQQAKVQALRTDATLSRQEKVAKMRQIGEAASAKFKAVLTPGQSEKLQKMRTSEQNGRQRLPAMKLQEAKSLSSQTNAPGKLSGPVPTPQGRATDGHSTGNSSH